MPLTAEVLLVTFAILFGAGVIVTAAFFAGATAARAMPWWPTRRKDSCARIRCRYCHFGRAYVREETARIEDDDLIEVTCYVCRTCNLPQWRVQRSPVLKRAA